MLRATLDRKLRDINKKLTQMGEICVEGIELAVDIMVTDKKVEDEIERVHEIEKETDRLERELEDMCTRIIVREQPVAGDLKIVTAAFKMIADMERIGDQIADIADIGKDVRGKVFEIDTHIREMTDEVIDMIRSSIEAYVYKDVELALEVEEADEKVDQLFVSLKKELLEELKERPENGELVLDTLMIGKYLERLADHAVNISQWVRYAFI
ncbi:MAG: phosphate signaling complex protein PhoU [Eubacterium sp.]|nr:phosphate signaling complex protein PhoU [Eubacterium sp.]